MHFLHALSPMTPPLTYQRWQNHARALLTPLAALRTLDSPQLPLGTHASDHDAQADRLEAFVRPGLLAALYLCSPHPGGETETAFREDWAQWLRRALVLGTDPAHPAYWGPNTNYHQNGVEIGLYVLALHVARDLLWEPLTADEKTQVVRWIASNRGTGHHWNNHLFFGVFALEFLLSIGEGSAVDERVIDKWMDEMEAMVRTDGWFMDGINQSYDHYNAYTFHFYGPLWAKYFSHRTPERKARGDRWLRWCAQFIQQYQYMFAASGEHPAFGRSITYRFNAVAPFGAAALAGCNPLAPGLAREICTRNLEFFLEKDIYTEDGTLNVGWHDAFAGMAEPYSCSGSTYWAAKAFIVLLIPPEDPFWTAPVAPLPTEQATAPIHCKSSGLVLRNVRGEVEILNGGSLITPANKEKFGPWKWGKLHYRSGIGFCIGQGNDQYSRDACLTARDPKTGRVFGRHYTVPVHVDDERLICTYSLGDKFEQFNLTLETELVWRDGWLCQFHRYTAYNPAELCVGGYALAAKNASALEQTVASPTQVMVENETQRSAVIYGKAPQAMSPLLDERLDESRPRLHVQAPYHLTPGLMLSLEPGEGWLVTLVGAGPRATLTLPQAFRETKPGAWEITWDDQDPWKIESTLVAMHAAV